MAAVIKDYESITTNIT